MKDLTKGKLIDMLRECDDDTIISFRDGGNKEMAIFNVETGRKLCNPDGTKKDLTIVTLKPDNTWKF